MCALLWLPSAGMAYENATVSTGEGPVVRFTRSLAQLDRVSGLCQDIQTARYETYSLMIRKYIRNQYDGEVPYWVLSNVKSRVMDQNACKGMVTESLIHYQTAYQEYVEVAKPRVMPPHLTESMSQYGYGEGNVDTLGVARPTKR
ncbi:MAG: hypothetical protein EBV03_01270 [Proteobacteria bacterium]|nr:hypothetical protein [Pseudomonadota bacterium]